MIVVTLRERLRQDTRDAHDAADRACRAFELDTKAGLGGYLLAQRQTAGALLSATREADPLRPILEGACADIDGDLAALALEPPAPGRTTLPKSDHPLARSYVWLAAQFATRMRARRWGGAPDGVEGDVGRYLRGVQAPTDWRAQTDALDALSGRGREADRAMRAARDWFAILEHGAVSARRRADADA